MDDKHLTAVVVNFNTLSNTCASVASLCAAPEVGRVIVVDNGSCAADFEGLVHFRTLRSSRIGANEIQSGFAEGSNAGVRVALGSPECDAVLFLNSDAELLPGAAASLVALYRTDNRIGLVGGRVTKPSGATDSLGIAFYASCLASNRMNSGDRFFGPTGGCVVYRRQLLEALQGEHGYMFDPDFFCYAEDTDVAARALLLGFRPAYFDGVVALHEGQVSSGGGFSDFILYHGIRNSIWVLIKCVPWPVLLLCSPLILLMYTAIAFRHGLGGKGRVVYRLYRDAFRGVPGMLRKRRVIQSRRKIGARIS